MWLTHIINNPAHLAPPASTQSDGRIEFESMDFEFNSRLPDSVYGDGTRLPFEP
jgi:hypothetical protein